MTPIVSEAFLRTQSDERLVSLARRGHHQAFVAIVLRYERELLAFARRTGPDGRAEDVVQQALLNAFVALRNGSEVTHLRGWLYAIVRRTGARAAGAGPAAGGDVEAAQTEPLEDTVLRRARARATLAAVRDLPRRQREALLATAFAGSSRAQLAHELGQSEGVVRQLVHRARANVRSAVGAVVPFPVLRWLVALQADSPAGASVADATAPVAAACCTGLVAKLGVVLASGVVATGAVVGPQPAARHPRTVRHPVVTRVPARAAEFVRGAEVATAGPVVVHPVVVRGASMHPAAAQTMRVTAERDGGGSSGGPGPSSRDNSSAESGGSGSGGLDGGSSDGGAPGPSIHDGGISSGDGGSTSGGGGSSSGSGSRGGPGDDGRSHDG